MPLLCYLFSPNMTHQLVKTKNVDILQAEGRALPQSKGTPGLLGTGGELSLDGLLNVKGALGAVGNTLSNVLDTVTGLFS